MTETRLLNNLDDARDLRALEDMHMVRSSLGRISVPLFSERKFYVIRAVSSGLERYWIDGKPFAITPDRFLITPPRVGGRAEVDTHASGACIYVPETLVHQIYGEAISSDLAGGPSATPALGYSVLLPARSAAIGRYAQSLSASSDTLDKSILLQLVSFLHDTQQDLSNISASKPATRAALLLRVQTAHNFLQDNTDRSVTVEEVARACGLSRYHLMRTYKEVFGVPPMRAHQNMRLDRAKEAILLGCRPAEMAAQLDFDNLANFSRAFLRRHGIRPTQLLN